jgi:RNA polymerase sigma factor (sigma-70 family)
MLSTWVGIIARTQANRFLRKQRRTVQAGAGPDTARLLAQIASTEMGNDVGGELKEVLRNAWESLPHKEQVAVKLFYFGGRNYRDIAQALKLSPNSVGSMLFRARMKLKENLKKFEEFLH